MYFKYKRFHLVLYSKCTVGNNCAGEEKMNKSSLKMSYF